MERLLDEIRNRIRIDRYGDMNDKIGSRIEPGVTNNLHKNIRMGVWSQVGSSIYDIYDNFRDEIWKNIKSNLQ